MSREPSEHPRIRPGLRTGCLVVSYFQLILAVVAALLTVILLVLLRSSKETYLFGYKIQSIQVISYLLFGIETLNVIAGFLGVWGTHKRQSRTLFGYLVMNGVCVVIWLSGLAIAIQTQNPPWGILFGVMMVVQLLLYCPVHWYRQEIRRASSQVREFPLKK
ncbi:hypothetical protein K493DRAFT_107670 [Basidiobolus meristosporus CBS 931.73]|uniref:Uncharacterized protein n=1 Tax=Basidiobolus meristosporus CBS 931.73 TaxID=1314790 RepID=A0A1Y1XSR1_9FUNG|nr:hypothetical protein K493DRAFT_75499 [Basidiobolus meristosporus CBS 931.73]ORX99857.1 hypothetical protein K493DRAFT_107670 [Basidiobolus meristosporus CBS 931.73]|eukprot:ORX88763.1 hypothetical protein K493DRAFT_75499 [Basidiobolus meristosporus CBS 931.73]